MKMKMRRRDIVKVYRMKKSLLKKEYHNNRKNLKDKNEKQLLKQNYVEQRNNLFDYYFKFLVRKYVKKGDAPYRRRIEEIGNAISHGLGALFSITALILMVYKAHHFYHIISAIIYFMGLFFMFGMSTLYHSFPYGSRVKRVFRRFDYNSIYLLISSTYTPIILLYLKNEVLQISYLTILWTISILGIVLISVFGPFKLKKMHLVLYFLLGWSAIIFIPKMIINDLFFFSFIIAGGIIYTLGIIPFSIDKRVSHFLWHLFVLAGAIVQFVGIYLFLY